uniref:FAD-binding PCMH-type domain-containing protein n=1 Tax=Desulfomonile tiedjei TaxID=2358 RepID=A0A7C4EVK9_9BACT
MMLPKFSYSSPKSLREAFDAFQEARQDAVYLSGGTDLIPRLKLRLEKPTFIIDLKHIDQLKAVEETEDSLKIGALASIFDLKNNPLIKKYCPALDASLDATSCETLQMKGTIGGNLLQNTRCLFYNQSEFWRKSKGLCLKMGGEACNAVPGAKKCFSNYCSDNAAALCTVNAKVKLEGIAGERIVPLPRIFSNNAAKPFRLEPGEILTEILIPKQKTRGDYEKLRLRGAIDYPLLGVAFSMSDGVGKLALIAVGAAPKVLDVKSFSEDAVEQAAQKAMQDTYLAANTVLDPDYRKRMIAVLSKRLIKKVAEVR